MRTLTSLANEIRKWERRIGKTSSRKWLKNQHHPIHSSPPNPPKIIIKEEEGKLQEVDDIRGSFVKKNIRTTITSFNDFSL